ncbi:PilZ domain-containing protein [Halomonas sp. PAMB 3264]|uniref:HD domain-containing phosphohydrolase n=1 Tax=Halomonas sp. PAMB 3264 TaxID=3075222 RepID=UPI002896B59C|nr:HD domain-containing phosphohydrolase [Halomonas sp. PAMB 3264]WNL42080.1 PilZ domain-containing protein [Halomonas sp. PAMB 3264]
METVVSESVTGNGSGSSAQSDTGHVQIVDQAHIARVLVGLDDRRHALTVAIGDQATDYPAHLEAVSLENEELLLTITDAGSLSPTTLDQHGIILKAENDQQLSFERIEVHRSERAGEALKLWGALPGRLTTAARRGHTRIALRRDMSVEAALTLFEGQPPLASTLRDISGGGCLVQLPLAECVPLIEGTLVPHVTLTFPNGERFSIGASVRHVTPVVDTHDAAVGLAFEPLDLGHQQQLMDIVSTTQREIAWRSGEGSRLASPSALYTAPDTRKRSRRQKRLRSTPVVASLKKITRDLHLFLLALQSGQPLPIERLERSANRLIKLHGEDRQALFYGLTCLTHEPGWLQHSLGVAGKLADLMLAEPSFAAHTHRAVRAALMHDMGKALLIDENLPSLESEMSEPQRQRLQAHVTVLMSALSKANYPFEALERDIIGAINERLDGSGYPRGVEEQALSPIARMAAVIDVIDAMTRARGDRPPLSAVQAYRYLYNRPARFDQHWVTRYVQRHGFYPLGSLVEFSNGYLAWVLGVDERGQPNRVRVIRNLRWDDAFYDDEVGRLDFEQLGRLTGAALPHLHDL